MPLWSVTRALPEPQYAADADIDDEDLDALGKKLEADAEEDEEDLAADTQELGKELDAGDEDEDEKDVLHDPKMDRHVTSHS